MTESKSNDCPDNWQEFNSSICLRYIVNYLNFMDASSYCISLNASLVLIDSEEKQSFIANLTGSQTNSIYWIGLRDVRGDNAVTSFMWFPSGKFLSETSYSSWGNNYPRSYKDQCAYVSSGLWNNVACGTSLPYICEINAGIYLYSSVDIILI